MVKIGIKNKDIYYEGYREKDDDNFDGQIGTRSTLEISWYLVIHIAKYQIIRYTLSDARICDSEVNKATEFSLVRACTYFKSIKLTFLLYAQYECKI